MVVTNLFLAFVFSKVLEYFSSCSTSPLKFLFTVLNLLLVLVLNVVVLVGGSVEERARFLKDGLTLVVVAGVVVATTVIGLGWYRGRFFLASFTVLLLLSVTVFCVLVIVFTLLETTSSVVTVKSVVATL